MLDFLKGIGKVATVVGGANPAIAGIVTAFEVIEELAGDNDDKASAMYMELAADSAELTAAIVRYGKDGKYTKEERQKIIAKLKDFLPGKD